jgi:hypothetical protein
VSTYLAASCATHPIPINKPARVTLLGLIARDGVRLLSVARPSEGASYRFDFGTVRVAVPISPPAPANCALCCRKPPFATGTRCLFLSKLGCSVLRPALYGSINGALEARPIRRGHAPRSSDVRPTMSLNSGLIHPGPSLGYSINPSATNLLKCWETTLLVFRVRYRVRKAFLKSTS